MKKIIQWFTENIVAANLFMALILISGYLTLPKILMEVFPIPSLDIISISVPYPGASPIEIEKSICTKIEENVTGIESVKTIRSTSFENQGVVYVELLPGEDISKAKEIITTKINTITTFPEESLKPLITEISPQSKVITVAVSGDINEEALVKISQRIQDEISLLPGITLTTINGIKAREISIEVSEQELTKYNFTFDDIVNAVKVSSIDLPAGKIESSRGEYLIRTEGQAINVNEFNDIALLTKADGTQLKLGDVAYIRDGFIDNESEMKFNGLPTKLIDVYRVGNQNALEVSSTVQNYVENAKKYNYQAVQLTTWDDESKFLRGRIDLLLKNARIGLILVGLMLAIFLKPKLAFWVSLGIPISFMGALWMLPYLDISINLLSLFTFILVLGIVVDDAIIIGENVYRYIEKGYDLKEAAIKGTHEVGIPVIFAILTTIATFSPMLFIEGSVGRIWRIIPLVVIPTLVWSLIESLTILPAHLSHMKQKTSQIHIIKYISTKWNGFQTRMEKSLHYFIREKYKPLLAKSLNNPMMTISIFIFILLINIGIIGGGWLKFSFFPPIESDVIKANIAFPQGTPIETTKKAISKIENAAEQTRLYYQKENDQNLFVNIFSSVGFGDINVTGRSSGPGTENGGVSTFTSHAGEVVVELITGENRDISVKEIVNKWRDETGLIAGIEEIEFTSSLFSSGAPINIQITGLDFNQLNEITDEIKNHLKSYRGIFDIKDSYSDGKDELKITLLEEAKNYGVTNLYLAKQVRQRFFGEEIQTLQRGRDEIKVVARFPKNERENISNIEKMKINTPDRNKIEFGAIAKIERSVGSPSITRINRKRSVNITADVDNSIANSNEIVRDLEINFLPELLNDYPFISFTLEGEQREQNDNLNSLANNYILSLIIVYLLLAIPFRSYIQPFIVMSAIPFGIIGAVIGHLLLGMNFSILSMIGIVALSGVVVNDSLVLVDFINRYKKEGRTMYEAALESGQARFRPILLTSLTTFVGLTPLLLEKSLQAQFLIPMAISLGFGVLFSTFITLILIPNAVLIVDNAKTKFLQKFS